MRAYVNVVEHPYFAVSDASGAFSIPNLPAGEYTVEAWHEKLGVQTQAVKLGTKEVRELDFKFISS